MKNNWKPFGKNILFEPQSKDKAIGDTSRFFFYGKVLAVGNDVKDIKVGDIIGFTQWSLNKIVMSDKSEHFFCREDDEFILAVLNEA